MADSTAVRARSKPLCLRAGESLQLTPARRPWAAALLLSVSLSLLFILVYGGCNALAAQRMDLRTCFFAWELRIPFAPALILPYMSIDLFFVVSPFLCQNVLELRTLGWRITAAILVAGAAFVAFPLTAGYTHPQVSGWSGWLFGLLWSFDKPHNLVPSLHVALASLLWPVFSRHIRPSLRWLLNLWFTLIVVSALFTWQHHILDIAMGAMLGQVCMFVFPERREPLLMRSAAANLRVAGYYAAGAAVLAILAIALGAWFFLLLWPAASLALIAMAYGWGNSAVFRKVDGRLPSSTRVLLGPYLCGAFARRFIYERRGQPWVEVTPGVYCGRWLRDSEALMLRAMGISGVLDMTAEHAETRAFLAIDYLNVPVLDLTQPSQKQLDVATAFIREHARRGGVYVHCALGISRSAAAVAAYIASQQTRVHSSY
jgi:membrane-associated phospholipid phosphatase